MACGFLRPARRCPALIVAALLSFITMPALAAEDGEQNLSQPAVPTPAQAPTQTLAPPVSTADFLFGAPRAWLSLRGAMLFPRAGGDLFAFVSDQLTVSRSDLRAAGFATDVGTVVSPTVDIVIGFDTTRRETSSEYRHFIASNAQPITQVTALKQTSMSGGLRFSPAGRGRAISRYAFIPRRLVPYGGAGLTFGYYDFSQRGQFVDYTDLSIFPDRFTSNGWSVGPYVNGGVDIQVWKRLFVTFDGRYTWLHSGLDSDFSGFDGIDLAGFRGGTGISIVF